VSEEPGATSPPGASRARHPNAGLALLALGAVASVLLAVRLGVARDTIATALREPESIDRAVLSARGARLGVGARGGPPPADSFGGVFGPDG
jgi:hypothetical protein